MLRTLRALSAVVAALIVMMPQSVGALTDTDTFGRVCGHRCPQRRLATFGGYVFKGGTWPSRRGQIVRFDYRRRGGQKWHRFGRYNTVGTRKAFRSLEDGPPRARINRNHHWSMYFAPYKPGRWVVRAKFIRQDGYQASSKRVRVRVVYSD